MARWSAAGRHAGSGHPGTPVALAPLAYRLFTRHLRHDPPDPAWPDCDLFVLSAGHASRLLCAAVHLSGYDLSVDDLRASSEAASLAGFLGLGKLTVFYDENHTTIEGATDLAFREQVNQRFLAYGWHAARVDDVNDLDAVDAAVAAQPPRPPVHP